MNLFVDSSTTGLDSHRRQGIMRAEGNALVPARLPTGPQHAGLGPAAHRLTDMFLVLSTKRDHPDSRERHMARKRAGLPKGSDAGDCLCA